jgi:hypothetical protein
MPEASLPLAVPVTQVQRLATRQVRQTRLSLVMLPVVMIGVSRAAVLTGPSHRGL